MHLGIHWELSKYLYSAICELDVRITEVYQSCDVDKILVGNKFRKWRLIREIREMYGLRNISALRYLICINLGLRCYSPLALVNRLEKLILTMLHFYTLRFLAILFLYSQFDSNNLTNIHYTLIVTQFLKYNIIIQAYRVTSCTQTMLHSLSSRSTVVLLT